ncbi:GTP cyclohydrolase II, partial [Rhodococcus sp. T2V]|uniref:GTP cyclohydrolase II n=1 Tax=Rhodococcus sp. T2V TaxID=3034164 RepID=UPI0023E1E8AD
PMGQTRADELSLPPMVADSTDSFGTAFTVSVDLVGTGTGVSAAARTETARALADAATRPDQLHRPGHVFPLRAHPGGVLVRAGHTEAAVDLLTLAGLSGVGVISELVTDEGDMMRGPTLEAFANEHDLPLLAIADLVRHRRSTERLVEEAANANLPTTYGKFRALAYRSTIDSTEHLALVMGDVAAASRSEAGVLVRVHSECLTGDILGSLRCDCGDQLRQALQMIADEGCGAVVYLRGHEGRGIGLAHKIRAYALQEEGLDTVDANTAQGLPADARSYGVGAQILDALGIQRIRLITNNPAKYQGLDGYGFELVDRLPSLVAANPHNLRYLHTKRDRMGHSILPSETEASTS